MKTGKMFMGLALFSVLSCCAFYFDENGIQWLWENEQLIPVILICLGLSFFACWKRFSRT